DCTHPEGSIPVSPDECEALCHEARQALDDLLQQARFLLDYPLGFPQRFDPGGRASRDRGYYLHSCMGAAVQKTAEAYHIQTDEDLEADVPFVVAGDGTRLLYLWPLLAQRVSPLSERHTLYIFEDLPDPAWPFLTAVRSSAIDVREDWRQRLHTQ